MDNVRITRLAADDKDDARALFMLMARVFEEAEEAKPLSDKYLDERLQDPKFWVLAAYQGRTILGGITAHTLPMTKGEYDEIFIYDLAVDPAYQRQGFGRRLVTALRDAAAAAGIYEMSCLQTMKTRTPSTFIAPWVACQAPSRCLHSPAKPELASRALSRPKFVAEPLHTARQS